jgi:hypothetical protein
MSNYEIKPQTFFMARKLGVKVRPSENPKKKIDVFDSSGNYLCSIGDVKYKDYPTYLALGKGGEDYANERRRLYHIRHRKNADVIGSKQYFALRLLW